VPCSNGTTYSNGTCIVVVSTSEETISTQVKSSSNKTAIIVSVIGSLVACICLVAIVFIVVKKNRVNSLTSKQHQEERRLENPSYSESSYIEPSIMHTKDNFVKSPIYETVTDTPLYDIGTMPDNEVEQTYPDGYLTVVE